jgi:hypothetical protein
MASEEGPLGPYVRPEVTRVGDLAGFGGSLSMDSEQQQQQQQQQQRTRNMRRFLDSETMMPQEEVVTKLSTEIKEINRIAPRKE